MAREHIPMMPEARDALIAIVFLWVIFGGVVFFRFLGRIQGVGLGADDFLALASFIISASNVGITTALFVSGVGYPFDPESDLFLKLNLNMEFILKLTFVFTIMYIWTLAALKLSQVCFYRRAFGVRLSFWIYSAGVIIVLWATIFTFVFIFLCTPVKLQWTLGREGYCMDQMLVLKCLIMTNVVTDLMIIILPISTVWSLQMRKTEKVAILSCFALGFGCCIIGVVRFWQVFVVDLIGNLTGTSLATFTLCTIELMLAGLCINIPMLRPFYLRWRKDSKASKSSRMGGSDEVGSNGTTGHLASPRGKNLNDHNTWIELEAESNGDGESEINLTRDKSEGIVVSTKWSVSRS